MNKLIPLSEYVELQEKIIPAEENGTFNDWNRIFMRRIISYTRFLRQPLTLGMFVPVDEEGNILVETPPFQFYGEHTSSAAKRVWGYKYAKERVLFEGFELVDSSIDVDDRCLKRKGKPQVWATVRSDGKIYFRFPSLFTSKIEDLAERELPLTRSALKIIGKE